MKSLVSLVSSNVTQRNVWYRFGVIVVSCWRKVVVGKCYNSGWYRFHERFVPIANRSWYTSSQWMLPSTWIMSTLVHVIHTSIRWMLFTPTSDRASSTPSLPTDRILLRECDISRYVPADLIPTWWCGYLVANDVSSTVDLWHYPCDGRHGQLTFTSLWYFVDGWTRCGRPAVASRGLWSSGSVNDSSDTVCPFSLKSADKSQHCWFFGD